MPRSTRNIRRGRGGTQKNINIRKNGNNSKNATTDEVTKEASDTPIISIGQDIPSDHTHCIPKSTKLFCLFHNPFSDAKEYKSCTILEVEERKDGSELSIKSPFVYYIHYNNMDRRMDEWVERDRLASSADIQHWKKQILVYEEEKSIPEVKSKRQKKNEDSSQSTNNSSPLPQVPISAQYRRNLYYDADVDAEEEEVNPPPPDIVNPSHNKSVQLDSESGGKSKTPCASPTSYPASSLGYFGSQIGSTVDDDDIIRAVKRMDEDDEARGHSMDHGDLDAESLAAHHEATRVKNIGSIIYNGYEMEAWYFSPYPVGKSPRLYLCTYCLDFFIHHTELQRHYKKCFLRHPPGNEIYRSKEKNTTLSFFEVDGAKEVQFCQNLCYMAKLFLDHKLLYWDTIPFLFYVMTELDSSGYKIVGYFSKEKHSDQNNNLACILTLPCHQRKGYGRLLMQFSYELSKIEFKPGTPERPLSDLGRISYISFWSDTIASLLENREEHISITEISRITCITTDDIIDCFTTMGIIKLVQNEYVIDISGALEKLEAFRNRVKEKMSIPNSKYVPKIDPKKIHFVPFVPSRKRKVG